MLPNHEIMRCCETDNSVRKDSLRVLAQAIELRDNDSRLNCAVADFDGNGFAKGWQMAVGRCFRDSLDIKPTRQVNEAMNRTANEAIDRESVSKWTQGGVFSFSLGDTIYDTSQAYQRWDSALKAISLAYQVLAATPSRPRKELIYLKRNTTFASPLGGGAVRREKVLELTPVDWTEEKIIVDKLSSELKKSTGKGITANLLRSLCDTGALDRRIEVVEPRFPGMVRFRVLMPNAERTSLNIKEEKAISQDDFVALLIAGE